MSPKTKKAKARDTVARKVNLPASAKSTDARARRSGQALREALIALLEEQSFDQITVRSICKQAGIHYATFFRHHATKEALLDSIAREQIVNLNSLTLAIRENADYEAGFRALCAYINDHRDLFSTLLNGGAGAAMREEWVRQSQVVAAQEDPINSWLPADLGTVCAATLIAETIAWWVAKPADYFGVDEVAEILMRLLTTSIIAPDSPAGT